MRNFFIFPLCGVFFFAMSFGKSVCAGSFIGRVRWYGQGCFLLTVDNGVKILTDPFRGLDYPEPFVSPDIVLISHEHFDSNNVDVVNNAARIVRGLKDNGRRFNPVDMTVSGIRITNISTYHDKEKGVLRGLNSVFIIQTSYFRYVHLGNLGHLLSKEQLEAIGRPDVLLIPVGGFYALDGNDATEVVNALSPRITIPMYYATSGNTMMNMDGINTFLKEKKRILKAPPGVFTLDFVDLPSFGTILLLDWRKKH